MREDGMGNDYELLRKQREEPVKLEENPEATILDARLGTGKHVYTYSFPVGSILLTAGHLNEWVL